MEDVTDRQQLLDSGYVVLGDTSPQITYLVHVQTGELVYELRKEGSPLWFPHRSQPAEIFELLLTCERYRLFPDVPLSADLSVSGTQIVMHAARTKMSVLFPTFDIADYLANDPRKK